MSIPDNAPRRRATQARSSFIGSSFARRLHVESLEDRRMLAVITVDSLADNVVPDGNITLREAVQAANTDTSVDGSVPGSGADTINFSAALSGQTITLAGLELEITEQLTIDGTTLANGVTIDGDENSQIFNITAPTGDFQFNGLTLTGGKTTADNVFPDTNYSGGAIRSLTTGNLMLDGSTITGNSTTGIGAEGGGVYAIGNVTLTDSTVSGNSTTGIGAAGGGVYAIGDVTLTDSTVSGNRTLGSSFTMSASGGGVFARGDVTLTASTVSGNSTAGERSGGGGVLAVGDVMLTGSTVSGNSTANSFSRGGGVSALGNVTLSQSTVTNNEATGIVSTGGGISNTSGTIIIDGSIVAGNSAGGGNPDIDPGSGTFTVNFSLLGTGVMPDAGGSGNLFDDNPLLGPLANNGGPTETHELLAGSPAIDRGSPLVTGIYDQRGEPFLRIFNGRVDIGAYEQQSVPGLNLTVDTNADEIDGDYSAGDLSLREAVGLANGSLGADTITFAASLSGDTIELGGTEIVISEALAIDATALAQHVTLDGNQGARIFRISAGTGDFTFAGLTLTGGSALGVGGAIASSTNGILAIEQSNITGNRTTGNTSGGGGIRSTGSLQINNSTVSGNSTIGTFAEGGGILATGTVTLTNTTISGNSTAGSFARGGGIRSTGVVTLNTSTVTANEATHPSSGGGGIWSSSTGATLINNSIVSGNSAGGGISDDLRPGTGTFTANFSLLGTFVFPSAGSGNIFDNNPQLGPLTDNGGPTETHALLVGSPAIDAGDPSFTSPPDFDQRGAPFVRVSGARLDIGAIEDQPTVVNSADFDGDNDIDGADFLAWQRGYGTPNANREDGDANSDNLVDADDLTIWGNQFGSAAPLVAGLSSGHQAPGSAALIDAAVASELFHATDQETTTFAFGETTIEAVFNALVPAGAVILMSDDFDAAVDTESSSDENSNKEPTWLADQLLERVFGET